MSTRRARTFLSIRVLFTISIVLAMLPPASPGSMPIVVQAAGQQSDSLQPIAAAPRSLDNWAFAADMHTPRAGHTATLLRTGKVLVVGGYDASTFYTSGEFYDPIANTWSFAASMSIPRAWHSATLLANGKVLVAGGGIGTGPVANAELYDPDTDTWVPAGNMSTPREQHAAVLLDNGKVLVLGGFSRVGTEASAELYDPVTNSWSVVASMNFAHSGSSAVILGNGNVLVAGGGSVGSREAELYDPITNIWLPAANMSVARTTHSMTLLNNGKVLVAGGYADDTVLASAELYDPAANTWSSAGNMSVARSGPTATTLSNGQVLVAGGYPHGSPFNHPTIAEADLYDPASNTWSSAPRMNIPHGSHTATRLGTGKVLVIGGSSSTSTCCPDSGLTTAELYTPVCTTRAGNTCETVLTLDLNGPAALTVVNGQYTPNPFEIVSTVQNTGPAVARDVQLTLYLPAGLVPAAGSTTQAIGNLAVGEARQISWSVQATGVSIDSILGYFVAAAGSNAVTPPVGRQITIPSAFLVNTMVPNRGGDNGSVTVRVYGSRFVTGMVARLVLNGQEITGAHVNLAADGLSLSTTFDLSEKPRGVWDLVVGNIDGSSQTLHQAFTIEAGHSADVWVDIIGRSNIRTGQPQTFYILYGNRGNVDAVGTPLWISGIPRTAIVHLGFEITHPTLLEGEEPINWNQVSILIEDDGAMALPLFLGVIPAGFTGVLPIQLTTMVNQEFTLRTWVNPCYFHSPMNAQTVSCLANIANTAIHFAGLFPGVECLDAVIDGLIATFTTEIGVTADLVHSHTGGTVVFSLVHLLLNGIGKGFSIAGACGTSITPVIGQIIAGIEFAFSLHGALTDCPDVLRKAREQLLGVLSTGSHDPNDKVGSRGVGESKYLSGEEPLRYEIVFENVLTATAPAQDVIITDQLDLSTLNLSTLNLGPITFGNEQIVPPPGLHQFSTDVDLRPENNLIVRINTSLDMATGIISWHFTSLDPATKLPIQDPQSGFLPPNAIPPEGEGSVFYTIQPKQDLVTGTEIRNRATIVFDANAPLDTPEWRNTLDNTSPASQVLPLAPIQTSPDFHVDWSGTDIGAGVIDYTIFVSEDAAPYRVWLTNTITLSETFTGEPGKTYAFYSVARDETGNQEDPPTTADATTQVLLPTPTSTPTDTLISTSTPTGTPMPTSTPANTPTLTSTPIATPTSTNTQTPSNTPTGTLAATNTQTATPTSTSVSPSDTPTNTRVVPSNTPLPLTNTPMPQETCVVTTPTAQPAPAFTPRPGCLDVPNPGDLEASLTLHANTTEATFINHSATCSYPIGLAIYRKLDEHINHQQLHDYRLAVIPPNSTLVLTVNNPSCAFQVDAFWGNILYSLASGVRYDSRLLDDADGNGRNYCSADCPTNTPTITPRPVTATSTAQTLVVTPTATSTPVSVPVCTIAFSDVPPGSPFYSFVRCLACRGILSGYSDGTYRPNSTMTRGQVAKLIANAAGYTDTIPATRQTFHDVPSNSPFWLYIERVAAHGVISGYSDNTFRPANSVTRGQAAKFVANAAGYTGSISPTQQTFHDVDPHNPFWLFIERVAAQGVVAGYADGTFRPNNSVTRGQTAKFVGNAFFPDCQTPHTR